MELLVGGNKGRFPSSNCLFIKGVKSNLLVDAGCQEDQILEVRSRVDAVIYTHIHPDHISKHHLLAGIPSYQPSADAVYTSLPELAKRYTRWRWREWIDYVHRVFGLTSLPPADYEYGDWDTIRVGDIQIEAIPAPGHMRGHHVLIIGDHVHLSDIDLTSFGPWYGHPESSIESFIADIKASMELGGRAYTTSHRERIFTREEAVEELGLFLGRLCQQFSRVAGLLSSDYPLSPGKLVGRGAIYKRWLPGMEEIMEYFEYEMITKILDFLSSKGVVVKKSNGYVAKRPVDDKVCSSILDMDG